VTELPPAQSPGAGAPRGGWSRWQSWLAGAGIALAALSVITAIVFTVARPLGFAPLRPRAFPGFTVSLPPGQDGRAPASEYRSGRITLEEALGVDGMVQVRWEPGALYARQELDLIVKAIAALLKATPHEVEGSGQEDASGTSQTRSWSLKPNGMRLWLTQLGCGGRRVLIVTAANLWGGGRLHHRIVGTFQCHPDPLLEKDLDDVPVVLDVGPGWSRMRTPPDQIQITDGAALVMARPLTGITEPDGVVAALESGQVWPDLRLQERSGDHWPIDLKVDGDRWPGWLVLKTCADRPGALLLLFLSPAGRTEEGLALLQRSRCRRKDEAAQRWPAFEGKAEKP
jgi:hypothetical protein